MGSPPDRLSLVVWRLSNYADISGRGGLAASGRWHTRPKPIVYCSDEPHTAYCEMAKQFGAAFLIPESYRLLEIATPSRVGVEEVDITTLDPDWSADTFEALLSCRGIGDGWLGACRTVLLKAPSAARLGSYNFLLNPIHRQADDFSIVNVTKAPFPAWVTAP